jgi:signal transduction histidine kinase
LVITVTDQGAGIPAEERHAVFEPFYRSERTSEFQSGMGIGLTVVRRLMKAQGGRVWLAPPSERGSRFCFSFKLWTGD